MMTMQGWFNRVTMISSLALLAFNLIGCSSSTPKATSSPAAKTSDKTATTSPLTDEPGRVYLANRRLSFMPPDGFVPMPAEEVAKKYPSETAPLQVFSNEDRTASIAITFTQQPLTLNQLPELQGLMSKHLEKTVPGLKWIRKDLLAINGGSWLNMEGISQNKAGKLHSDMYFTSFQERMIGVNFSAEAQVFPNLKQSFQKSRDSIQVLSE